VKSVVLITAFRVTDFIDRFAGLMARQEFVRETLGSVCGDPLWIWTRHSRDPNAPVIFLSAGIHGDERCGPEALLRLVENWTFSNRFDWVIAPLLNPSGFRQGTRCNEDGTDLNRDFLRCQCLETRALMDWWRRQPKSCDLHLSLHEDWEAEGFYLYEIDTSSRESLAARILAQVAETTVLQETGPVDGHQLTAPGLIVHAPEPDEADGWPEAIWLARTWPLQSYTFEAPGQQSCEVRVEGLLAACRGALELVEERTGCGENS